MKSYRKMAHSIYSVKCHIVRITKYRKPLLGTVFADVQFVGMWGSERKRCGGWHW